MEGTDSYADLMAHLDGPDDFWDRPAGDWGTSAASSTAEVADVHPDVAGDVDAEARSDANTAYRLGNKALRRGDLDTADTWFAVACEERHPGAAFRAVVVHVRRNRGLLLMSTGSGKTRDFLATLQDRLTKAAEYGHEDARICAVVARGGDAPLDSAEARQAAGAFHSVPRTLVQGMADCMGGNTDASKPLAHLFYVPQDPEFYPEVRALLAQVLNFALALVPTPQLKHLPVGDTPSAAERLLQSAQQPAERPGPTAIDPKAPFPSVQYALRVLETMAGHPAGVSEAQLARESGLPAVHLGPMLLMLRREGYVTRVWDGVYAIGDSLMRLGSGSVGQHAMQSKLQGTLEQLRDSVGGGVYLSRDIDGEGLRITQYAGSPQERKAREWFDFRTAEHASAVGKSLLTQLVQPDPPRRGNLIKSKLLRRTPRTRGDERTLLSAPERKPTPEHVPPPEVQEYAAGTVCAAMQINSGSSVGCLTVSVPVERMHRLAAAADLLKRGPAKIPALEQGGLTALAHHSNKLVTEPIAPRTPPARTTTDSGTPLWLQKSQDRSSELYLVADPDSLFIFSLSNKPESVVHLATPTCRFTRSGLLVEPDPALELECLIEEIEEFAAKVRETAR